MVISNKQMKTKSGLLRVEERLVGRADTSKISWTVSIEFKIVR